MKNMNIESRREFIEKIALGVLGVSIPNIVCAEQTPSKTFGKAKHVIYLYLDGGISHTDFLDPKEAPEIRGNASAIKTTGDFLISSYYPKLAAHGDKFIPVRSMVSKSGAHAMSKYTVKTSYNKSSLIIHPTMGSISYNMLGKLHPSIPDYISISPDTDNPGGGYFNKKYYPLSILNPTEGLRYSKITGTETEFNNRNTILNSLNNNFMKNFNTPDVRAYSSIYDEAMKLLKSEDLNVFDLNKELPDARERYGRTQIGSGLLLAKRLIKSGVRYCEVTYGGFDMHSDLETNMTQRGGDLDNALSSLFDDLKNEGLLKDTLIVVATDFGRTPKININNGKDHHASAFSMMLGGMNLGGYAIGKTTDNGEKVEEDHVTPGMFNATIGHLMGIDPSKPWLTPSESSAPGRPMSVGNKEMPIKRLV
jgi:Protein of unknown function (DUF1501)